MTGADDEFDDFLKRRKPVFRSPDDLFEPPAELDRVVLRQAREAIETERPVRVFRNPRWATPVAVAATVVLAFTVIFYAGLPRAPAPVPEVTVQNVAERVDISAADMPMESAAPAVAENRAREEASASGAVMVDLPAPALAKREPAGKAAGQPGMATSTADASPVTMASPPPSTEAPPWRQDAKSWLAEIERLRNAGDTARADAEYAEFKRQQRAYAGSPDR